MVGPFHRLRGEVPGEEPDQQERRGEIIAARVCAERPSQLHTHRLFK